VRLLDYCDSSGYPNVGIACDASCVGFKGTIKNDGYFHGRVEWQCIDLVTKEKVFASDVQPQSTINVGEFMAIVTSLKILHKRGDTTSPVWSDSKLCIQWVVGRYTSSHLPMNEFTWEALDGMAEYLEWLKKEDPVNPILWWNKHKFGDHPADYGRKGSWSEPDRSQPPGTERMLMFKGAKVSQQDLKGALAKAMPERATAPKRKEDPIAARAQALVDTFSTVKGTGTVITNCTCWPNCLHAEPLKDTSTPTAP
jgi:ribonuclease HI